MVAEPAANRWIEGHDRDIARIALKRAADAKAKHTDKRAGAFNLNQDWHASSNQRKDFGKARDRFMAAPQANLVKLIGRTRGKCAVSPRQTC